MRKSLVEPVNQIEANLLWQSLNEAVSGGAVHDAHGVGLNRHTRMSANAGIQQGFVEAPDSRMRGNDETTGCDSI